MKCSIATAAGHRARPRAIQRLSPILADLLWQYPPAVDAGAPLAAPGQPLVGLVRDVVVDAIEAIGDELSAQAAADTSAIDLRNGRPVGSVGTHRLWSFEVDSSPPVPPETPRRLVLADREPVRATILATGDLDIVLGVDEIGDELPPGVPVRAAVVRP